MQTRTITLVAANTEYTLDITKGCVHFKLQARTANAVRVSTRQGLVAGSTNPFWTIKAGAILESRDVDRSVVPGVAKPIYLATGDANTVVEVVEYF